MSIKGTATGRRSNGTFAAPIFFAFTAPLGILAHLTAEFAGLGFRDADDVLFSARHGYLAAIAIAAIAAFTFAALRGGRGSARKRAERIVAGLPFGGSGLRFVGLSFAIQFGFFASTQIGEGCPLCGGDVARGALAAAFASLAGAVFVALCKRRVVEFAVGLVFALAIDDLANVAVTPLRSVSTRIPARARRCALYVFRNRPPPIRS